MNQPFPHIGYKESIDYLDDSTVIVKTGTFGDASVLFIGSQNTGCTIACNTVWQSEIEISKLLAAAKISLSN